MLIVVGVLCRFEGLVVRVVCDVLYKVVWFRALRVLCVGCVAYACYVVFVFRVSFVLAAAFCVRLSLYACGVWL